MSSQKNWLKIVHLCLRRSEHESSNRLAGTGPQCTVALWIITIVFVRRSNLSMPLDLFYVNLWINGIESTQDVIIYSRCSFKTPFTSRDFILHIILNCRDGGQHHQPICPHPALEKEVPETEQNATGSTTNVHNC
jgi:hypothetical protein